jgi:integrase
MIKRRERGATMHKYLTVSETAAYLNTSERFVRRLTGDAWVFTGERGNPIRSGNRNLLTGWKQAVVAIGRPGLHFHDLRHTGNTLAAQTYVSTKDLMARMGQDSPRAALIYQHASRQVDQTIANKLSALIECIDSTAKDPDDGGEGGPAGDLVPIS